MYSLGNDVRCQKKLRVDVHYGKSTRMLQGMPVKLPVHTKTVGAGGVPLVSPPLSLAIFLKSAYSDCSHVSNTDLHHHRKEVSHECHVCGNASISLD